MRQVGNGTLSGCAVCAVTFWESSPGPRPDGSRLPGISWSCLLDAAQLGAAGSDKHTRGGMVVRGCFCRQSVLTLSALRYPRAVCGPRLC